MSLYLALGEKNLYRRRHRVRGGGAALQLARKLGVMLVDLTCDGNRTHGVLNDLDRPPTAADMITLTAGGNDLLGGEPPTRSCAGCTRSHGESSRSALASSYQHLRPKPMATTTSRGAS
jgi:lysophospholipase L1-like esterase